MSTPTKPKTCTCACTCGARSAPVVIVSEDEAPVPGGDKKGETEVAGPPTETVTGFASIEVGGNTNTAGAGAGAGAPVVPRVPRPTVKTTGSDPKATITDMASGQQKEVFTVLSRIGGKDSLSYTLRILIFNVACKAVLNQPWTPKLLVRDDCTFAFPRYVEYKASKTDKTLYPSVMCRVLQRYLCDDQKALLDPLIRGNPKNTGSTNHAFFKALGDHLGVTATAMDYAWTMMEEEGSPEGRTALLLCAINRVFARLSDPLWHSFRNASIETQKAFLADARAVLKKHRNPFLKAYHKKVLDFEGIPAAKSQRKKALETPVAFLRYIAGHEEPACVFGAKTNTPALKRLRTE